jgi:hypothetical protein
VPIGSIGDRKVTTIEGIGAAEAGRKIQRVTRDLGAQVEVQGGVKAGDRVIRRSIFPRAATCVWPRNEAASHSSKRSQTMRSIFAGIIMLSASMAFVHAAQAQRHSRRPPGYDYTQAGIGHRQPSQEDPHDDLQKIEKDNRDLNPPASHDDIVGAGQVESRDDALTKRIEQESEGLDREIRNICPSC